jgi:signal transduction histidine kinase
MNWNKWITQLGLVGGTALISISAILISVLIGGVIQFTSGTGFQLSALLASIAIPLVLVTPLAYIVVVMLFQLEEADIDKSRKEAQIDYLKRVVSEKDGSEKDQLIRDLNSFAQTVAHDLKTPLTTILGFGSMLADHQAKLPPEQQKEALQTIVKTSLKMNNIIQELLLLAAVRQSSVKTGPVQMTGVLNQVKQRMAVTLKESGAELIVPDTTDWPKVIAYASWVEEVWINYISNAIKYGGKPPLVEVGVDADFNKSPAGRNMARFWVRDNGHGIPQADQGQLFNQFTRLDQVRAEGHGLGLSIVARVIEKLGGEVGVESAPGKGSLFYFTLPMMMVEPPTRVRPQNIWMKKK